MNATRVPPACPLLVELNYTKAGSLCFIIIIIIIIIINIIITEVLEITATN